MNNLYFEPNFFLSIIFFSFFLLYSSNKFIYKKFLTQIEQSHELSDDEEVPIKNQIKTVIKYEDKYLDKLKKMSNEYNFNIEERILEANKYTEFLETDKIIKDIKSCEKDILLNNDSSQESALNEILIKLNQELILAQNKANDEAKKHVINLLLERLSNCFIIETTPLGNVIMLYNNKRETFEYYSDSTIPYRYLETACRKYVIVYNCKPLYIDMDIEIKNSEKKIEERIIEEKLQEQKLQEQKEANKLTISNQPKKKDVFTKFKSYNTEAGTGRVNSAAPSKNNIQNVKTDNKNEKFILKENANRYSYQGKTNNFSIIKKIDKKLVNKKYSMSFADFKKYQQESKNQPKD